MSKLIIIIVTAFLLLTLTSGAVLADGQGKGPAEKATGCFEYYQPGYFFDFNAHASKDGRPVKGEAWNYTPSGGWYHAKVRCVNVVDEDTIIFAAELVDTNVPSWGPWVLIRVDDGGEPGAGADQIWGQFLTESNALSKCMSGVNPSGGPWNVLSGNLQVHTR